MEIGPANPVLKQFRMNSWSPDTADSSVKAEAGTPPDSDRPTHKLRTALGLPSIPPVTVELPEASPTRPASVVDQTHGDTKGGNARGAPPGLPVGGGGLSSNRFTPTTGSNSRPGLIPPPRRSYPPRRVH